MAGALPHAGPPHLLACGRRPSAYALSAGLRRRPLAVRAHATSPCLLPLLRRYKEAFEAYITAQVLPSLRDHQGEVLLKQFWHRSARTFACSPAHLSSSVASVCTHAGGRARRRPTSRAYAPLSKNLATYVSRPLVQVDQPQGDGALAVALLQLPRPILHPASQPALAQ